MAAFFVLTGVSGDNVFARHVGMTAPAPAVVSDVAGDVDPAAAFQGVRRGVGDGPGSRSGHDAGDGASTAHLLHLLGACLTLLGVGVLLLCRRGWWRVSAFSHSGVRRLLLLAAHWVASARGSPPLLAPPRTSPVMRT